MDLPRLSQKEYLVLDLLRSGGEAFGLEMVKASNGSLKRGTIYVTLNRMEEKGYLISRHEKAPRDPGMPRRLYQITAYGGRTLKATDIAQASMGEFGYA